MQYDFGGGPVIDGRKTVLFCAWLACSRFRIVILLWDNNIGPLKPPTWHPQPD